MDVVRMVGYYIRQQFHLRIMAERLERKDD
jgi:hypothetical protein